MEDKDEGELRSKRNWSMDLIHASKAANYYFYFFMEASSRWKSEVVHLTYCDCHWLEVPMEKQKQTAALRHLSWKTAVCYCFFPWSLQNTKRSACTCNLQLWRKVWGKDGWLSLVAWLLLKAACCCCHFSLIFVKPAPGGDLCPALFHLRFHSRAIILGTHL